MKRVTGLLGVHEGRMMRKDACGGDGRMRFIICCSRGWIFLTSFGLNTHYAFSEPRSLSGVVFFFFPGEVKLSFRSGVSSYV